jgi:hypothetical protein
MDLALELRGFDRRGFDPAGERPQDEPGGELIRPCGRRLTQSPAARKQPP